MKNIPLLLTHPGNGVYTVHTGQDKKEKILKAYYGKTPGKKWQASLLRLDTKKPWVFGIPSDTGGGIHRGANWGPLQIREELLPIKDTFHDVGDVRVIPHLLHDKYLNEATIKNCRRALYGRDKKLPVAPLSMAELALSEIYKSHPGVRIFGMGGDHSCSYPLVKTWLHSRKSPQRAAVLHFDAHTDLLNSRLGIDLCFGTWTYKILDDLHSSENLLQIGIRSSKQGPSHWKKELGITQIWARGFNVQKALAKIKKQFQNIEEIYISFDIDALDQKYASATGTPEKGGLLPTDCAALIKLLSEHFKITGADLMEVAPFVWPEGIEARDQKASLTVAGDMARILLEALRP